LSLVRAPLALVFAALAWPCTVAGEIVVTNAHLEIRLDDRSGSIRQVRNVSRGLDLVVAPGTGPAFVLTT
jgi:hypothetical protein